VKAEILRGAAGLAILCGVGCLYLSMATVRQEAAVERAATAYLQQMVNQAVESRDDSNSYKRPQATLGQLVVSDGNAHITARIDDSVEVTLVLQKSEATNRWSVLGVESLNAKGVDLPIPERNKSPLIEAELRTAFQGRDGVGIQRY